MRTGNLGRWLYGARSRLQVMKYRLLSAVIMLCVSHNAFAEMREFKSQKGAVFKAEPLVVRGPNLVLKGENGREVTVAIKSLSREDQNYILRWMVHEPRALSYSFDCRSEEKTGETKKLTSRLGKLESTEKSYQIKINNRCQNPIDDLKVSYRVFLEDRVADTGDNREVGVIWKGGLLDLGRLTYNQTSSISTNSHPVQKATPNSLASFAGVDVKVRKDQMRGVWIKFYRHGVEVSEWKSPGVPKCDWPASSSEVSALEADAAANKKRAEEAEKKGSPVPAPEAPSVKPGAPAKVAGDDLPQELRIFELEDVEKK